MTIQIARGKQVQAPRDLHDSRTGFNKELYLEVSEGVYVSAKLNSALMTQNLKNTYGSLLLSKVELEEVLNSGCAQHPRGGYLYFEEEIGFNGFVRDVLIRWDTESRRIC